LALLAVLNYIRIIAVGGVDSKYNKCGNDSNDDHDDHDDHSRRLAYAGTSDIQPECAEHLLHYVFFLGSLLLLFTMFIGFLSMQCWNQLLRIAGVNSFEDYKTIITSIPLSTQTSLNSTTNNRSTQLHKAILTLEQEEDNEEQVKMEKLLSYFRMLYCTKDTRNETLAKRLKNLKHRRLERKNSKYFRRSVAWSNSNFQEVDVDVTSIELGVNVTVDNQSTANLCEVSNAETTNANNIVTHNTKVENSHVEAVHQQHNHNTHASAGSGGHEEDEKYEHELHERSEDDFSELILKSRDEHDKIYFHKKDAYNGLLNISLLMQNLYLALWATNFITLVHKANENKTIYHISLIVLIIAQVVMCALNLYIASILSAVCSLHNNAAKKMCEENNIKIRLLPLLREEFTKFLSPISQKNIKTKSVLDKQSNRVIKEMEDVFNMVDLDGNGDVDMGEFCQLMYGLEIDLPRNEIQVIFDAIDVDHR
jgi:nicotinamidase-related amidase